MRKALIILVAVALLGIAATYVKPAGGESQAVKSAAASATASATGTASSAAQPTTASNTPTNASSTSSGSTTSASGYADGTYRGTDATNRYGDVQVSVTISGGKITAVNFDSLAANDPHSEQINSYASPKLVSQTLSAQSANISGVSGATYTSSSYMRSLQSALDQANG